MSFQYGQTLGQQSMLWKAMEKLGFFLVFVFVSHLLVFCGVSLDEIVLYRVESKV